MDDVRQKAITLVSGGMRQCDVAHLLGVPRQNVNRWMRGEAMAKARAKARQAPGRKVAWPMQTYRRAMSLLKDGVPPQQVSDRLGVPRATILGWKYGRTPKAAYDKARRLTDEQRRRARRVQSLRQYYRREHRFHPAYNPDYDLAPLRHLWYPRGEVLDHIRYQGTGVHARLDNRSEERIYQRMSLAGRVGWARFDMVDKLFAVLDLSIHELGDPIYCKFPTGPHIEQEGVQDVTAA